MNHLTNLLVKIGILKDDLDYHLIRASMVIIFFLFGYQKWFQYEAQALIPYISNGPLIFWMYPVFGIRGATYFLGAAEWLFGALLFLGFWNKRLGILGALGSCFSFVATVTIIPFMPDGWAASAGGFPAMTEKVAFLMKDLVLFAVSFYLLKQDVVRASLCGKHLQGVLPSSIVGEPVIHLRRRLSLAELQADEIQTIVGGKERPIWIFVVLDVWSRLWPSTMMGRRSYRNTLDLFRDVSSRMILQLVPLITTDGFKFCERVIGRVFGPTCVYGQVIKTRRNDRVVRVERKVMIGEGRWKQALQDSEDSETLNTSFVERLNLTVRQDSTYLGRERYIRPCGSTVSKITWSYCAAITILLHTASPHYVSDKSSDS
jgi:uncharacterized membrane protein YkgB